MHTLSYLILISTLILQTRKLREDKSHAHCLKDSQWQSWNLNPGCLTLMAEPFTASLYNRQHITEGPKCKLQSAPKLSQSSSIFNTRKRKEWSSDFENLHVNELEIENQESLWPSLEIPQTPSSLPLEPHLSLPGLFLVITRHHILDQWSRFKHPSEGFGYKQDFF